MTEGQVITSNSLPALFGKIIRIEKDDLAIIETIDRMINPVYLIVNLNYWH